MFEDINQKGTPPRRPLFEADPTPARKVAEGAMLVACAVIFGLSASYLPFIWLVALFLWPVPLALLVRRFGAGFGLAGILLTALLLSLFIGPLGALSMLINMGGVGFWYGWAARRGVKPWLVIVVGVLISAAGMLALLALSSALAGFDALDFGEQVHEFVQFYVNTMDANGNLSQLLGTMTTAEYAALLEERVLQMLPSSLIFVSMFEAGIAYALTTYIFRRLGYAVAKLPPFVEWRLPWYTLWGLIIALACWLLNRQTPMEILQLIADNVMYIYQALLMLAGLTFFYWQAAFWNTRWMLFVFVVLLIFAFQLVAPALVLVGLLDSLFDLRQVMRRFDKRV